MAFWSSNIVREMLPELVQEGDPNRIKHAAYELSLGPEIFVSTDDTKRQLAPNEQASIPPGQMALLLTEESVTIPADVIGLISIKSKHKLRGLINISGFHVDPGFSGRLVFSVYNAGPKAVPLTRGAAVFLIWFCSLDQETYDPYNGAHQGQTSISDDMVRELHGTIASPAALQTQMVNLATDFRERVNQVQAQVERVRWLAAFIGLFLGAMFSGVLVPLVSSWLSAIENQGSNRSMLFLAMLVGLIIGLGGIAVLWLLASQVKRTKARESSESASGDPLGGGTVS